MDHPFKKLVIYKLPEVLAAPDPDLKTAENIVFIDEQGTTQEAQELLAKILKSVQVVDFAQIEVASGTSLRLSQSISLENQNLISFGPQLSQLGLSVSLPLYQLGKVGGLTILIVDDLAKIAASNAKKKMLWEALKEMFHAA